MAALQYNDYLNLKCNTWMLKPVGRDIILIKRWLNIIAGNTEATVTRIMSERDKVFTRKNTSQNLNIYSLEVHQCVLYFIIELPNHFLTVLRQNFQRVGLISILLIWYHSFYKCGVLRQDIKHFRSINKFHTPHCKTFSTSQTYQHNLYLTPHLIIKC